MAYRIEITELSDQDLDEIFSYIALSLANPTAARGLADAVDECYDYLEKMSLMYRFCDDTGFVQWIIIKQSSKTM